VLTRIRQLAVIAGCAGSLVLIGASASAQGAAAGTGTTAAARATTTTSTTVSPGMTARSSSADGLSPHAGVSCNNTITANYTSPSPRVVNWTATESCNSVIGAIAILASTLYYDGPSGSYAIAEGTHPTQSPSYDIYSTGTGSPSVGGNFHVQDTYQILLAAGQGSWNLAPNCFYYLSGYTNAMQCTTVGAEFTLAGNPTISTGGVVNGTDYSANDIHPGTTIAIFGQWFSPADTVLVTVAGQQFMIGSGSLYWYDSTGQINATLPGTIPTGAASVVVIASNGLSSNAAPISIQP
jgi:hypothetical protein